MQTTPEQSSSQAEVPRVIPFADTEGFDRGDFQGHIYVPGGENVGFSALTVFVKGRHPLKRIEEGNTRNYVVVDGAGTFKLNGEPHVVGRGDFVNIPAGGEYEYEGEMVLFEFNVSPDNTFKDTKLEQ